MNTDPLERVRFSIDETGCITILISGDWHLDKGLLSLVPIEQALSKQSEKGEAVQMLQVIGEEIGDWDSTLISFLFQLSRRARERDLSIHYEGIPKGALRLVTLAEATPENKTEIRIQPGFSITETVGKRLIHLYQEASHFTGFVGESVIAFMRFYRGKSVYRKEDLYSFIEDAGPASLPIVTLISVLIGMILAFVGAVQLEKFGASIYVASLVGLSMAREMGAMMTAIIMSGRTGAAYAAQLGSMQVNEEIDALKTMGVAPSEFLVVPRMLALVLMLPLLTIYANLMGILGGALVSMAMLDVSWSMYIGQMMTTVPLYHFLIGLFKSFLFGVVIALSGCFMGMSCGRSASAVGRATTNAVVLGIVLIILCDSIVTIATTVIGI